MFAAKGSSGFLKYKTDLEKRWLNWDWISSAISMPLGIGSVNFDLTAETV